MSGMCPPCVRLVSALCPLWPHLQTLSALSALSLLWPASKPCPPLSRICRPCVRLLFALCPPCPRLSAPFSGFDRHGSAMRPPCVRHVSAPLFVSIGPPCVRSSHGLASGPCPLLACCGACRAVASSGNFFLTGHHCATHRVYIACPLVSFLGIHFGSPNSAFASGKTVWGLCCYNFFCWSKMATFGVLLVDCAVASAACLMRFEDARSERHQRCGRLWDFLRGFRLRRRRFGGFFREINLKTKLKDLEIIKVSGFMFFGGLVFDSYLHAFIMPIWDHLFLRLRGTFKRKSWVSLSMAKWVRSKLFGDDIRFCLFQRLNLDVHYYFQCKELTKGNTDNRWWKTCEKLVCLLAHFFYLSFSESIPRSSSDIWRLSLSLTVSCGFCSCTFFPNAALQNW